MQPGTNTSSSKPLDDELLKIARRTWGWGDVATMAMVVAILYLIETDVPSRAVTFIAVGMAFVIAQERIRKRIDALVQLVERRQSLSDRLTL
jgi:hypothetical protein